MASEQCRAGIRAAAGRDLTNAQADAIEQAVRIAGRKGGIKADYFAAAKDAGEAERMAAAIEKRNALINLQARVERRARYDKAPDPAAALHAEIRGINTPTDGSRFSTEAEWKAQSRIYQGGVTTELEHAGLFAAARGGSLDRQWARELFELSKGADGKPGVSGSKEALGIAQILHKYQALAKDDANKAGAWIGDYQGYITRTSHDPDAVRRAGFAAWREDLRGMLDERTFVGVADPEKMLRGIYNGFITGVHLTHEGMVGLKDPAFAGPGNLAKRMSQDRVLHFKDADAWLDYHEKYGRGGVAESIVRGLDQTARSTALMRHFGTNPRAELADDMRFLEQKFRDNDTAKVTALRSDEKSIQNEFDHLDGTANMPVNRLLARIASGARLIASMAKLGGVMLTHLPVAATKAAELHYQGIGLLQGYGDYLASFVRGRGAGETRAIVDLLHAGHEGMLGDLMSHFSLDDGVPGTLSKLANTFFKWTGLTYVLNAQRAGAERLMALHLGNLLDTPHAELPPETQRMLRMFGIAPEQWEMLRGVGDHATANGQRFLTPDAAKRIAPSLVVEHLRASGALANDVSEASIGRAVDAFRDDLAMRLYAYYADRSTFVPIQPGIQTRATLLRGTRPGTPEGEALRFLAQFKTWPVALLQKAWGREWSGREATPAAVAGILHMALMGGLMGYGVMTLKDLAKGKNPRDGSDPATWGAALMQGGGLGILGDFLFGQYNRLGGGLASTALGPVLGEGANAVFDIWNRMKEGKDVKPEAFRLMLNNTPFINMFYTRAALDYLFLYQVQEALNPGFLRRYERRVQEQNHQTFWLRPSQAVR